MLIGQAVFLYPVFILCLQCCTKDLNLNTVLFIIFIASTFVSLPFLIKVILLLHYINIGHLVLVQSQIDPAHLAL